MAYDQAGYYRYRDKLKSEVLEKYGDRCACCGEQEIVFLALDHIAGNGSAERREIARTNRTFTMGNGGMGAGTPFYAHLRRRGWPSGYQILCFNCNFAKHIKGECPHSSVSADLLKTLIDEGVANDQSAIA